MSAGPNSSKGKSRGRRRKDPTPQEVVGEARVAYRELCRHFVRVQSKSDSFKMQGCSYRIHRAFDLLDRLELELLEKTTHTQNLTDQVIKLRQAEAHRGRLRDRIAAMEPPVGDR